MSQRKPSATRSHYRNWREFIL